MRKAVRVLIIVLLTGIMMFSVFMILRAMRQYSEADDVYESLQSEFVETRLEEDVIALEVNVIAEDAESDIEPESTESTIELVEAAPISVDFTSLLEQNSDIVGWLYCPDTPINYPVVHGRDNDQYLHADLNGNYLVSGTIFADYRNGEIGEDANYIVYGHNMKNGTMFASLAKYKEQSYYDEHPVWYFLTPDGDYRIELYAGIVVKQDSDIYSSNFDETAFDFFNKASSKSTFVSEIELAEDDMLITLSTCSYEYSGARYVVIGRLIPLAV